jgi:hypothetical protein
MRSEESFSGTGPDIEPSFPQETWQEKRTATEHLSIATNIALKQPIVFLPTILSGFIGLAISWITSQVGIYGYTSIILSIIGSIISFILSFASIDMMRDAYNKQQLDLSSSINYVINRFIELLIASIVGGLMAITIILIPVVIMMFVIIVIDETTLGDSISKSINVLSAELGDILIIILISIIGSFVLSYVPFISSFLQSALNVIISLSFIDLYKNYKDN